MANGEDRIEFEPAINLLFNHTSKTIADLQSRQWSATTLAVAGIIFVDKFYHDNGHHKTRLVILLILIVVGYALVFGRCLINLLTFRNRLNLIATEVFPAKTHRFSKKSDAANEKIMVTVDEGTINWTAIALVLSALVFVLVDMLC